MIKYFLILFFSGSLPLFAQDTLPPADSLVTEYVTKTFWSTRIINGHSVETLPFGELEFRLSHRMGRLTTGPDGLFGLYQASSQFGFEYGINDRLMAGLAGSTIQKLYMGFLKYKILRQCNGAVEIPVTLSFLTQMEINSGQLDYPGGQYYKASRYYYVHQLIIARKFNDRLSLQISPVLVHRNMVKTKSDKNNVFCLGGAGRYKFSRKMAVTAEYYFIFHNQVISEINNEKITAPVSAGIDFYLGRHTIQIHLTNCIGMDEKSFLTETTEKWNDKGIHFGFNIATYFTIAQKNE
jgi:hypothetical protein